MTFLFGSLGSKDIAYWKPREPGHCVSELHGGMMEDGTKAEVPILENLSLMHALCLGILRIGSLGAKTLHIGSLQSLDFAHRKPGKPRLCY